jgi:hypothetical protein
MRAKTTPKELAEIWDVRPDVPVAHSRLYCLEPVGIGTPAVESMTSYVVRLAEAHHILTSRLVVQEMMPNFKPKLCEKGLAPMSGFWQRSGSLNGIATWPADWVRLLQGLTGRNDLRYLTMLPWAAVLASPLLLRATRAWCPDCYAGWHAMGQPVYDPLLWALRVITMCPTHQKPLQTCCPYPDCGRSMLPLSPPARTGHCAHCGRWLGIADLKVPQDHLLLTESELRWQEWAALIVGELLMSAPRLGSFPTQDTLATNVPKYFQELGISQKRFEHEVGISLSGFQHPHHKQQTCTLPKLLCICARLGISLLALLDSEPANADRRFERIPDVCNLPRITPARKIDWDAVHSALKVALASQSASPSSMRQIAQQLGHMQSHLIRRFPDLCHAISARYRESQSAKREAREQRLAKEIREASLQLQSQGIFPSRWHVQRLLGYPLLMRDVQVRDIWREVVSDLGLLKDDSPKQ